MDDEPVNYEELKQKIWNESFLPIIKQIQDIINLIIEARDKNG